MAARAFQTAARWWREARESEAATASKAGARPITAADVRAPGAHRAPLREVAPAAAGRYASVRRPNP